MTAIWGNGEVHGDLLKCFADGALVTGYNVAFDLPPDQNTLSLAQHEYGKELKLEDILDEVPEKRTKSSTSRIVPTSVTNGSDVMSIYANMT